MSIPAQNVRRSSQTLHADVKKYGSVKDKVGASVLVDTDFGALVAGTCTNFNQKRDERVGGVVDFFHYVRSLDDPFSYSQLFFTSVLASSVRRFCPFFWVGSSD